MAAIGTLTIEMAANVARLQRDMERARGTVDGAMTRIRSSVQLATRALGALGGALSIKAIVDQADAMNLLNSRLKLVTNSQQDLIRTQAALVNIANRTYTSISGTVDLYTALARSTKDLNVSQGQLLTVVETFNKAIIISGGSVQSAQAAITQFNQAMASGVLRGEEFNSISEQAPMIMEMLSQSLGVTRGALRDMAKEGLLTADVVLAALQEGADGVSKQFDQMDKTVGQATNQLTQSLSLLIAEMNKATGSTSLLAKGLDLITFSMNKFREAIAIGAARPEIFNWLEGTFSKLPEQIQQSAAETARLTRQMNEAMKVSDEAVKGQARAILAAREEEEKRKKAAEELLKTYEKLTERLRGDIVKGTAALQAEQQGLNKAQEEFLELVSSSEWNQYTAAQKILVTNLYKQKIGIEQAKEAELTRQKELAEAERRREKEKEDNQKRLLKMLNEETEARREWIAEDKKAEEERIKAQERLYAEHRRQIESINEQLTDALMRAFESGKGFGKAFKDTLVNLFKTMVLRPILAPIVAGMTGTLGSPAAAAEISGTGGTLNILTSVKSAYQMISGGFTALGDSVAFAADAMGSWLVNNTSGVLNSMGGSLMQSAGTLGTAASYLGGAAAGIALGSVISGSYSAIGKSGNTATIAGTTIGAVLGGPIGAAIGGAIGGLVNRAFGRGPMQTTGTGISGTFTTGGANISQFQEWSQKGGWFRSDKSGVNYSSVSNELDQFLDTSLMQITQATRAYAQILGLNADVINGFSQAINIQLQGLTPEQQQEKIMQALSGFGDALAEQFLGGFATVTEEIRDDFVGRIMQVFSGQAQTATQWIAGPFVRAGETAGEALSRLATSLLTVNQVFDTLNITLMEGSLTAADAASQLIDLFGGAEQFVERTTAYYREFYTEAERAATTTRQLTEVLSTMGLQLPASRQAFRDLVEAQDLATESGRQTYAALLNLAPAFASITASMDDLNESMRTSSEVLRERESLERQLLNLQGDTVELRRRDLAALDESNRVILERIFALQDEQEATRIMGLQYQESRTATEESLAAVNRAIDAQKQIANNARDIARDSVNSLQTIFDILKQNIEDLYQITGVGMTAAQGRAFIEQAIISAQTTGYLPDAQELRRAIEAARSGLSSAGYATSFEMRRDQLVLASRLTVLRDLTGDQLSVAEKQLLAAERQIEKLDEQMLLARQQVDALRGINTSVLSVGQAMSDLSTAIRAEMAAAAAQQTALAQQAAAAQAAAAARQAAAAQQAAAQQAAAQQPQNYYNNLVTSLYQEYLGRNPETGVASAWMNVSATEQNIRDALAASEEFNLRLSMFSQYANGGLHEGGLRLVGERGPELEVTGPARYMSNATLASMLNNGASEDMRQLREENKVQMRSLVSLQNRMTKLLERWDNTGIPQERVET